MYETKTREIWFTTSAKGVRRAWRFSRAAFRAVPVPMAEAEMLIATGEAVETGKPSFVGRG